METPAEKKPKKQNSLSSVQRRKVHRATLRRRMHGEGLVKDASSTKTFLERRSVTAARERSYALAWDSLVSWAKSNRRDMSSVTALDAAVTVRLNEMFFDGHDLADGTTLLAAVKFFRQNAKLGAEADQGQRCARWIAEVGSASGAGPPSLADAVHDRCEPARRGTYRSCMVAILLICHLQSPGRMPSLAHEVPGEAQSALQELGGGLEQSEP